MELLWALDNLTWKALLDIFLVGLVFFGASFFFRGTQAIALLRGLLFLLVSLLVVSSVLDLQALRWLTQNLLVVMGLAIPVIFQPELRRALEPNRHDEMDALLRSAAMLGAGFNVRARDNDQRPRFQPPAGSRSRQRAFRDWPSDDQ